MGPSSQQAIPSHDLSQFLTKLGGPTLSSTDLESAVAQYADSGRAELIGWLKEVLQSVDSGMNISSRIYHLEKEEVNM